MKLTDNARLMAGAALLLGASGCAAEISDGSEGVGSGSESAVVEENGLRHINGLSQRNGLGLANGLNLRNGLTLGNGLPHFNGISLGNGVSLNNGLPMKNGFAYLNGLATRNGLAVAEGLLVDCTNGVPGQTCSGVVDGLLSAATGLLKDDLGKLTAAYLMKCALPEGDAISVIDYTGNLFTIPGGIGLAPAWRTEVCGPECQELVSACLMALTNGSGEHIMIEMRSTHPAIGQGGTFRYQEAAFYGNIFQSPPDASFCVGSDFKGAFNTTSINSPERRACDGFALLGFDCPFKISGSCGSGWGFFGAFGKAACGFSGDSATACSTGGESMFKNYNNNDRKWRNVITTYRNERPN
jgi:hypothetical protein